MDESDRVMLRADRPRYSLQRKLVLWTIVLAVVPTVACAVWLNSIALSSLRHTHARNVSVLGDTLAASMTGRLEEGWSPAAADALRGLQYDDRLAFVIVSDDEGGILHRHTVDREALALYDAWAEWVGPEIRTRTNRPIMLGRHGDLFAWRVPVFDRIGDDRGGVFAPAPRLEGFLTFAMRDAAMPQAVQRMRTMQLIAACVVCLLCLPAVVCVVRRWTLPLRELTDAIVRFGGGESPKPVVVRTQDEVGVLAKAFNDMTRNLVAAHNALARANEQLEDKVRHRTAELEQVNDRLQHEIDDKNEFLRAVSHDLSAPLRNIGGLAQMMLMKYREALADDAVTKLEHINQSVRDQNALLHELLELSRIRTRRGKIDAVDCQAILTDLRNALSYDLERAGITLHIDDGLPIIHAEKNRIRQVFQNLLDNAIKYMDDSEPRRIDVTYDADEAYHVFTVVDTGRGIARSDLGKVFQVFQRGVHSGSHTVPGRGVGLANVKAIIETLGGEIAVTSEEGKGSTFSFTFSRAKTDTAAASVACEAAADK